MKPKIGSNVPELQEQYREGRISRRELMRRAAFLGVSMTGISAFLASCAAPTPAPTPAPALTSTPGPALALTPTSPPSGPSGELRVGVATFGFETLDPVYSGRSTSAYTEFPVFDFLTRTDPSGVRTGIAERWEVDPDGLSWTFHIRRGIKFHNGDDLTADDVKFSLDRYAGTDAFTPDIRNSQESVEVLDDYTVRVHTKGVQPYYPRFVDFVPGQQGLIMPKDYYEKVGKDYFNLHPVGSGPFKYVRQVRGDMIEYEAVDKHYRQVPAFKKLTTILLPEEATRIAMLKTGALDAIEIGVAAVPDVEAVGLRTVSLADSQASFWLFGAYDPRAKGMPVADIRVRNALFLAINRDEIGRTFFFGKLKPPMPPQMWQNQPEIDVPYWKEEAAKVYRYDPEEAKRLLTDAGYPQGFTIKLYSFPTGGAPYLPKLGEAIQGYWLKIGVRTEIVPTDFGTFKPIPRGGPNGGPEDRILGQAATFGTDGLPMTAQLPYHTFGKKGIWGLASGAGELADELDSLIVGALGEPNEAKRFEMIAKVTRLVMDMRVYSVIGEVPTMAALGPLVDIDFPTGALSIPQYAEIAKHRKQ